MPKEDHEFNLKLLDAIKRRPCLYNYTLGTYSQRSVVYAAWMEVATELNKSLEHCRDTWRNIRTVLARHLKSLLSDPYRPNRYYLEEELEFVIPYMKINTRTPSSNSDTISTVPNDSDQFIDDNSFSYGPTIKTEQEHEDIDINEHEENIDLDKYSEERWLPEEEPIQEVLPNISSSTHAIEENKRKHEEVESENVQNLKTTSNTEKNNKRMMLQSSANYRQKGFIQQFKSNFNAENYFSPRKMFLLSLLPDIEQMNAAQMRKFRVEVSTLIDGILMVEKE